MNLRRRSYMSEAKKVTFVVAQEDIQDMLEKEGWKLKRALKVPHATKDGVRLWFKKQGIYASPEGLSFGSARSLHIDPRKLIDPRFDSKQVSGFLYRKGKKLADLLASF